MNMEKLKAEILQELKKNPEAVDTCEDYAFRFLLKKDFKFKREHFEELGDYIRPYVILEFTKKYGIME